MNKKDCEDIGFLLSDSRTFEEVKQGLFKIDKRIESEFIAYEEVHGRSEAVDKLAMELMEERNKGIPNPWNAPVITLRKSLWKVDYKTCLKDARKEVYGDDYHPSLFMRI